MSGEVKVLTADSQVIALLCTNVALARGELKPLTASEWSDLAAAIHHSELRRPGALLSLQAEEIATILTLAPAVAERLAALLRRGGQLAFELERLSSRGIWLITRADDEYPALLKERLKRTIPPVLYGAGDLSNVTRRGAAVIGSRNADPESLEFAALLGRRLAGDGVTVISGAARGVDSTAMIAAVDAGGVSVGVVAEALEKSVRRQDMRGPISEGTLTLISPYHPEARFNVGNAMRRNRLIYCLSQGAFVVASGAKGGTREGALENLKAGWVPLFVRNDQGASRDNRELLRLGGAPVTRADLEKGLFAESSPIWQRSGGVQGTLENNETERRSSDFQVPEPDPETDVDAFTLLWPVIAGYLAEPRGERDIASHFQLEPGQTRAWVKRAVGEGRVSQLDRPRRYQLAAVAPQLFKNERAPEPRAQQSNGS